MDGIQGAALEVKLRHLPGWTDRRRAIAADYDSRLAGVGVSRPAAPRGLEHVYHVYAVRSADRDGLRARLGEAGVATGLHYPRPVHLQPAYADLGHCAGDFPVSERLAGRNGDAVPADLPRDDRSATASGLRRGPCRVERA